MMAAEYEVTPTFATAAIAGKIRLLGEIVSALTEPVEAAPEEAPAEPEYHHPHRR